MSAFSLKRKFCPRGHDYIVLLNGSNDLVGDGGLCRTILAQSLIEQLIQFI